MKRIYFDHIASTPVKPEVLAALEPFFAKKFGNVQSLHSDGQEALQAVEEARENVARLIGASGDEVIFTASGTEANNFAVKGMALAGSSRGTRIVVSAIEHQSVLQSVKRLEKLGFTAVVVPVDRHGLVDPGDVAKALTKDTALVSIMTANSEVGTVEPIEEIARICRENGVPIHTDAVAAAGSIPLDVKTLGVDALSLAADQFYGPKGAAALFLKKGTRIQPLIDGGIQENGRRAGTENVPAIVGMGKAAEIALMTLDSNGKEMRTVRDYLIRELLARIDHLILTGHPERRLPHHASFCIEFVEGEAMLLHLDMKGIAASSGSACTSKALKASHVLLAMGIDHALAQGSLVFSLLENTGREDVDYLGAALPPVIDKLRKMSPLYTRYLEEKGR